MRPHVWPGALVVRPAPGDARSLARLHAGGGDAIGWPLFAATGVAWTPPAAAGFDSLLLTSTNAIRHAGDGLAVFAALPVIAVGSQTARVAAAAGLDVAVTGAGGVAAALAAADAAGLRRPLHLAGRDHVASGHPTAIVYASVALPVDAAAFAAAATDRVVLLHSVRAARRVADLLADRRARSAIAALSPAVCAAAGTGWAAAATAASPDDTSVCTLALSMIDRAAGGGDKRS
ncbi:uroporphyrinogen-III synthase [Sphingomonas sp. CV7422]|uniref:uroporphyrinogen-III synthase n=1 Tax=Sphingomonas sp. CV7422 TaxID=3018036 RepID=UPI0022FF3842|nr:uroporphyrinogen-III synthase [Sphingomonas sp. CV7422]